MAKFTDIFIRKPVLASVVSLLILLIGLRAVFDLPIRQFPKLDNTLITITTMDPGATASVVSGFITSPIEKSIASADGVDYITSQSALGISTIKVYVKLNYNPDKAFTSVMSKVSEVRNQLPKSVQDPVISKDSVRGTSLMYISFNSMQMTPEQITDYLARVVQPKLETVSGVSQAQILGAKTYAMRIWLNPYKMAAVGVTASDIDTALTANNVQPATGATMSDFKSIPLSANTNLSTVKDFQNIIVKGSGQNTVKLGQVATIKLAAQDYTFSVGFKGKKAVFMGISTTPDANPLTVIKQVRKLLPSLEQRYPSGLHSKVVYDATTYIQSSIVEVMRTIIEAAVIVILIILLFLGSLRTVVIPMVTIPLSLVGVCGIMLALGYSINLLTLLAMVLAIGMVVDDAIVVVENIYRHVEEGMSKFDAAIKGAREIAMPVISMTITLAAVFAPIGFMSGLTGSLFKEFAFTLAGTVIISGIIALTLSPMMCSKLFNSKALHSKTVQYLDNTFNRIKGFYGRRLTGALKTPSVVVLMAVVVLSSCFFLYSNSKKELAPSEDQSAVFMVTSGPQYANIDYMDKYFNQMNHILSGYKFIEDYFSIIGFEGPNTAISGVIMKPWDERKITQAQFMAKLQSKLNSIAGLQAIAFPLPSLPATSGNFPFAMVLTSTAPYKTLYKDAQTLMHKAQSSGMFIMVKTDAIYNNPQISFVIDRAKAQQLGVSMKQIADTLAVGMSAGYTNFFNLGGKSYQVIPQLQRKFRGDVHTIAQLRVRTATGALVPISTFVHFKSSVQPNNIYHFQQLNSVTIEGVPTPGQALGGVLQYMQAQAKQILPRDVSLNYSGQSRQYVTEGDALIITFIFSIIVIFLVLAAQFESFRDPLIILIAVPMSICGALIPLNIGLASVNIYTQIGLITLIGLISKHGILMVEFANRLQEQGMSKLEAIIEAAQVRLRAILMTTAAMIFGVVPLLAATGAGAHSRFDIGLVIACGMFIGTLFTLFVVPTMYLLIAKRIEPHKLDHTP